MTCQLALMTRLGVALASDSAQSVGKKTFDTRQKIFTLGGGQPIGFLVCGRADHIPSGVDWERVIYLYSEYLGTKTHCTLSDYVSDFVDFVGQQDNLYDDRTNGYAIQMELLDFWSNWFVPARAKYQLDRIPEVYDLYPDFSDKIIKQLENAVESVFNAIQMRIGELEEDEKRFHAGIRKLHGEHTKAAAQDFCGVYDLPKKFEKKMEKICNYHLASEPDLSTRLTGSGQSTGLVIAGFGSEQLNPELRELSVGAIVDPKDGAFDYGDFHTIRNLVDLADKGEWRKEEEDSTYSAISWILRYGHSVEIDNIIEGFHRIDFDHLTSAMPEIIQRNMGIYIQDELKNVEGIGTKTLEKIEKRFDEIQTPSIELVDLEVRTALEYGRASRWLKFGISVAVMSMQDLAEFSKHLISMEAEIMHYHEAIRYVSGPVNVATITKENGFSWVQ